jgi:DNA-binding transcriptional ArsR family regulator
MGGAVRETRSDRLSRLFRHPLRWHALFKYAEGVTSPRAIAADLRAPLNVVSYHTQVLLRAGAVELVRTERRRGATEHFYRAVVPLEIEDDEWRRLPLKLRRVLSRALIDGAMRESVDALAAGGMDSESTHLSRTYLVLDAQGQDELAALLRDVFARVNNIGEASHERAADDAVPHEVVVMSFERASRP